MQIVNGGHDGWDSSIELSQNGAAYYLGIDPS